MAVTQNNYTGDGSTVLYNFTFPYLATTDIKVKLDGVDTTAYSFANATTVQMNSAPANGAKVIIYRNTNNDNKKATFYPGSAIKAEDLNNNYDQILYVAQEVDNNAMSTLGDTAMQGDFLMGPGFGLQFEGSTDDDNETRLVAADPTADRTITLPNVTGNVVTTGDTGTVTDAMLSGGTALTSAEKTKLAGIETGATGDQTNAEIKAAVEAASDSNVFTDADHSKLNAIEASATADQTAAEIRTLVESATDSNVFTDADHSKLNAIEASATADQTSAEIRTLVNSATDSNVFTDADHTKLDGIATSANNYTHPNHSGEVTSTSDGATVIANNVVDEANLKISNTGSNGQYLQKQSGNTGGLTWATGPGGVGGDTGVDFNDNVKLRLGNGNDLNIFHDGSNSYIQEVGSGALITQSNLHSFRNGDNDEQVAQFGQNAACLLYYDNVERFATTSTGTRTTGQHRITNPGASCYMKVGQSATDNQYAYIDFIGDTTYSSYGLRLLRGDAGANTYSQLKHRGTGQLQIICQEAGSIQFRTNATDALTISSSQAATFTSTVSCTALTETSDIALKTNIEPITNVLDKINQITGYKYDYTKSNSSSMGVIAQDVEKVFPELVHGEEGSKSLQYSGLIGALIESVKELSAKVTALESN